MPDERPRGAKRRSTEAVTTVHIDQNETTERKTGHGDHIETDQQKESIAGGVTTTRNGSHEDTKSAIARGTGGEKGVRVIVVKTRMPIATDAGGMPVDTMKTKIERSVGVGDTEMMTMISERDGGVEAVHQGALNSNVELYLTKNHIPRCIACLY